jgi:hypothetical protein
LHDFGRGAAGPAEDQAAESKVRSDAELREWHHSKAFENSPTRQIVEKESHAVSPGFRTIHVYLPLERGRCHAGISFKTSGPEDTMLRIAKSVTLTKLHGVRRGRHYSPWRLR